MKLRIFFIWLFIILSGCSASAEIGGRQESTGSQGTNASLPTVELTSSPTLALATDTPTPTPSASITPTPTFTPTVPTLTPTLEPTLPDKYYISGMRGHKQYFPLGCEAATAVDWADFFGVTINEFEFQTSLPLSDNPDLGFVGSVDGPWGQIPPYAYGVHAAPVADLLQEYGLNAQAVNGMTLEELKRQIAMDQPVIAWVIGNVVGGIPYEYTDSQGNKTTVAAYEHVVIVTGFSKDIIRYDNNGQMYEIPDWLFENSWAVLGNMALVMGDYAEQFAQPSASDTNLAASPTLTVTP